MSYTSKEFNPSGSLPIARIKDAAKALNEAILEECPAGTLKAKSILDVQSATMFAVKSLFK
jgi:hypothetical protein